MSTSCSGELKRLSQLKTQTRIWQGFKWERIGEEGQSPILPQIGQQNITQNSQNKKYPIFKTDTDIITRTSPIQETVQQKPGVESKIKGIPSVSAQAGSNLNTVSMTPTQEVNIKNVESKIKSIPSVSAQAGSNLNTVSMTQTTKNNTSDESKINGIPSVSTQAGSNLNTVSMTHTLKLKNIKEVSLQHRKKRST